MLAYKNENITLSLQLDGGHTNKYVRAFIYDSNDNLIDTVNLLHVVTGLYKSNYTNSNTGQYIITYKVFSDSNYTTADKDYSSIISDNLIITVKELSTIGQQQISDQVWLHNSATQLLNNVDLIKQIETGRWKIINNQMIFYKDDNTTEILRFNLYDSNGQLTEDNVYDRRKV